MITTFCPLTGMQLNTVGARVYPTTRAALEYEFEPIGRAHISDMALVNLRNEDKDVKAKLAGICRNAFENGEKPVEITTAFIADLNNQNIPSTMRSKSIHLLKYMYNHGGNDYEEFTFNSNYDYPLAYATDAGEFNKIIKHLENRDYITIDHELGMAGHLVEYRGVTMTDEGIDQVEKDNSVTKVNSIPNSQLNNTTNTNTTMDIFISHSSHDTPIVKALIELLRSALNIPADKIRCTSVEGYKLPVGAITDDQIKREVFEAQVLLGVISPASVNSMYVAFELGARWGMSKPLFPITTSKLGSELLKGPLKGINALNSTVRADLLQLVTELGNYLNITPQSAAVYDEKVTELVNLSLAETLPTKKEANLNNKIAENISGGEYNDAEAVIEQHCTNEWPDDYQMRLHCMTEQKNALNKLKQNSKAENVPQDVFLQIRRKAAADWPTDFVMRVYAENEQISAYQKLHQQ